MASALTKIDHYFTRKNKYFPHLFRRSIARVVFAVVDRKLKKRFPDFEQTIFDAIPKIDFSSYKSEKPYTIFAVGDPVYIQRFAKFIALSTAHFSPGAAIHLHVIGESPEAETAIAELTKNKNVKSKFTASSGDVLNQNLDAHARARYCQCLRFVRAWQFSQATDQPLLIFDIDTAVIADLGPTMVALGSADIGLTMFNRNFDQAIRINAGAVYVAPSEPARKFLRHAAAQMLLHVLHGRFIEKLDQRCLSIAADRKQFKLKLVGLPHSLIGKTATPLIVTGQGKAKLANLPQKFEALGLD